MKITNRADYALHALFYVASLEGRRLGSINEIARAEGIPREYLAKILGALGRAGLLNPRRGRAGGYFLARPRSKITFLNIIEAMDGPFNPTMCTKPEDNRFGHRKGECPASAFFANMKRWMVKDLDSMNLADIPYEKFYSSSSWKNGATRKKG